MSKISKQFTFSKEFSSNEYSSEFQDESQDQELSEAGLISVPKLKAIDSELALYTIVVCGVCESDNYISKKQNAKVILCNNSGCRRILVIESKK